MTFDKTTVSCLMDKEMIEFLDNYRYEIKVPSRSKAITSIIREKMDNDGYIIKSP